MITMMNNVAYAFGELVGMISLYFLLRHFVRVTSYISRFWRRYNLKNRATAVLLMLGFAAVIAVVGFALYVWTQMVSGHFEVDAFELAFLSAVIACSLYFGKPSWVMVLLAVELFLAAWIIFAVILLYLSLRQGPMSVDRMMVWSTWVTLGMFSNVWLNLLFSAVLIWASKLQWTQPQPSQSRVLNDDVLWALMLIGLNPQKEP